MAKQKKSLEAKKSDPKEASENKEVFAGLQGIKKLLDQHGFVTVPLKSFLWEEEYKEARPIALDVAPKKGSQNLENLRRIARCFKHIDHVSVVSVSIRRIVEDTEKGTEEVETFCLELRRMVATVVTEKRVTFTSPEIKEEVVREEYKMGQNITIYMYSNLLDVPVGRCVIEG